MATAKAGNHVPADGLDDNPHLGPSEPYTVDLDELEEDGDGKGKKKGAESQSEGDGGDEELRVGNEDEESQSNRGGETEEEKRERRREERQDRKARREQKDAELVALRATVDRLQQGQQQTNQRMVVQQLEELDGHISTARAQYDAAIATKEKAVADNNGKALVAADEAIQSARDLFGQATARKNQIINGVNEERAKAARGPALSPVVRAQGAKFMTENPWYKPDGSDRDSARMLALDKRLYNEGYDPNTIGFWEELRERAKEELPHRFGKKGQRQDNDDDDGDDDRSPRRQTTGGSGRDGSRGSGNNTYTLDAQRVSALKEAGMWDDPATRKKMILKYREQDLRARANRDKN